MVLIIVIPIIVLVFGQYKTNVLTVMTFVIAEDRNLVINFVMENIHIRKML
jgi:hypothetical protein